jgi:hypothetical protein
LILSATFVFCHSTSATSSSLFIVNDFLKTILTAYITHPMQPVSLQICLQMCAKPHTNQTAYQMCFDDGGTAHTFDGIGADFGQLT